MSITVNTNMSALRIQANLSNATEKMNTAMERMSSGYKINSAKDDAAGYAVAQTLNKAVSGTKVASDNVAIGNDLLATAGGVLEVISDNFQRVRDLVEQASNGTYTTEDIAKIGNEINARLSEIQTMAQNATFNGKSLFTATATDITIQSGTTANDNVVLSASIFGEINTSTLMDTVNTAFATGAYADISPLISTMDTWIDNVTDRVTAIGTAENKLDAVADELTIQETNLTSALSTIQDSDTAEESAAYVQRKFFNQHLQHC